MIRKATPADIAAIVALGLEALEKHQHPGLIIDRMRVEKIALQCVSSAANFAWVAEHDGVVGAAVCAFTHPCMFHEGQMASVVQFYTKIPGEGVKLLRELVRWYRGRPALRMLMFRLEHEADPRIGLLLQRLGARSSHPGYVISG